MGDARIQSETPIDDAPDGEWLAWLATTLYEPSNRERCARIAEALQARAFEHRGWQHLDWPDIFHREIDETVADADEWMPVFWVVPDPRGSKPGTQHE